MLKFKRFPYRVGTEVAWSKRRESYAISKPLRHAKKQAKKIPLFEDELLSEAQEVKVDVDELLKIRQDSLNEKIQKRRNDRAALWRDARNRFFALSDDDKSKVLKDYNDNHWMPKEPRHLWSIVDRVSGEQARRVAEYEKEYRMWSDDKTLEQAKFGVQVALF